MGIFDAARDFYTASLSDNLKTKVKNGLVYDAKKKA